MKSPYWLIPATVLAVATGLASSLLLDRGHFLSGWMALLSSVFWLRWPISIWNGETPAPLSRRWRWGLLAAVAAMGTFFRFYHLDPPGLWGDDAINGLLAYDVLDGKVGSPFTLVAHAHSHFHALTNYLIAAAFWLLEPGITAIRLPGVMANLLCVPLLYATVAPLFGSRTALLAAAFFATSPLQLGHSKGLAQVVLGQLAQTMGLCLLVRGVTGRKRELIVASAVPFALCIYTYHAAKLAPLVAIPYALSVWRRDGGAAALRSRAPAAIALFLLCLIPAIVSYARFPGGLSRRIGGTSIWPLIREQGLAPLWDSLWRTLLIFHFEQGPIYHWFGLGFDPGLTAIVAFLAAHGLVTSLLRWREPRHLLLLTWAFVGLIPGFLSTEAPRAYRVLLASPPLYIWAALPVARLLALVCKSRFVSSWSRGVAMLLVLAVPLVDFNAYFYRLYTHPLFRHFQAERMVELARVLRERGPGWSGHLLSDNFGAGYETLRFLQRAWKLKISDVDSLGEALGSDKGDGGALFLMTGSAFPAVALFEAWYPKQTIDLIRLPEQRTWWLDAWWPLTSVGPPAAPIGAVFAVSPPAIEASRGLVAQFPSERGSSFTTEVQPQPRLDPAEVRRMSAGVARWSGLLAVPRPGKYDLRLQADGPSRLWLDQVEVSTGVQADGTSLLLAGLHLFSVEARVPETSALRFEWKPPDEQWSEVPAGRFFRRGESGLLATYEARGVTARRFEPYPFYAFFPETFSTYVSSSWRGKLRVPSDGRRALRVTSNGRSRVVLDGKDLAPDARIAAGEHTFALELRDVPERARLLIEWQKPDGGIEPVPPEAFAPPRM